MALLTATDSLNCCSITGTVAQATFIAYISLRKGCSCFAWQNARKRFAIKLLGAKDRHREELLLNWPCHSRNAQVNLIVLNFSTAVAKFLIKYNAGRVGQCKQQKMQTKPHLHESIIHARLCVAPRQLKNGVKLR